MAEAKPSLGEQIHYYDPSLLKKVGFGRGYDGRKDGPYLAIVTNDIGAGLALLLCLPMTPPFSVRVLYNKDDTKRRPDDPYWEWTSALQKARAQKRADGKTEEAAPAPRDHTQHPGNSPRQAG